MTTAVVSPAATPWRGPRTLTATRRLVRLILRRDRVRLALWVGGLVALVGVSAQSIAALYDTPAQLQAYATTVGENPALVMFAGPGYGLDEPSLGTVLVNETSLWMALGCGLMSVFLVNRHTRAEEESERADLVRSTVVGRHAPVAAALIVAAGANLAVAAGTVVVTLAFGYPVAGTVALGASIGGTGLAFAASTACAVQVASTGRAALGLGAGSIGLAFAVRGIGDIGGSVLSWFTPFAWGVGVRAYAGERWWTLLGLVGFAAGFLALALVLSERRDLGSGLLTGRPGPDRAATWSTRPLGLTLRLQRAAIAAWAVGLFLTGLVYGTVADDIEAMVADNPQLADYLARIGGASLTDAYLSTSLRLLAIVTCGFAISSVLRSRSEEAAGYAESMLAAPVSRLTWAGSHLVVTALGTTVVVLAGGLGAGVGFAWSVGDRSQIGVLTLASLVNLPAVLLIAGVAAALFGWFPRFTTAAWGALALVAVVDVFGTLLRLPHWLRQVSPLEHAPGVPAEDWAALPIVVLSLLAVGLAAVTLVGFRRRDLATA